MAEQKQPGFFSLKKQSGQIFFLIILIVSILIPTIALVFNYIGAQSPFAPDGYQYGSTITRLDFRILDGPKYSVYGVESQLVDDSTLYLEGNITVTVYNASDVLNYSTYEDLGNFTINMVNGLGSNDTIIYFEDELNSTGLTKGYIVCRFEVESSPSDYLIHWQVMHNYVYYDEPNNEFISTPNDVPIWQKIESSEINLGVFDYDEGVTLISSPISADQNITVTPKILKSLSDILAVGMTDEYDPTINKTMVPMLKFEHSGAGNVNISSIEGISSIVPYYYDADNIFIKFGDLVNQKNFDLLIDIDGVAQLDTIKVGYYYSEDYSVVTGLDNLASWS